MPYQMLKKEEKQSILKSPNNSHHSDYLGFEFPITFFIVVFLNQWELKYVTIM